MGRDCGKYCQVPVTSPPLEAGIATNLETQSRALVVRNVGLNVQSVVIQANLDTENEGQRTSEFASGK
jgi:hypothetical protein